MTLFPVPDGRLFLTDQSSTVYWDLYYLFMQNVSMYVSIRVYLGVNVRFSPWTFRLKDSLEIF